MSKEGNLKKLDKEFKKLTKNKFLSPHSCTQLNQTRAYIFELAKIINHFERKFDYVPSSARLLFNEYNNKQEKMLFKKFQEAYSNN